MANRAGADGQEIAVANVIGNPVQAPTGQDDIGRTESEGQFVRRLT